MIFTKTNIEDVIIVEFEPKVDIRGYFTRIFCLHEFKDIGFPIVQINQSLSLLKGTIRGLHMQKPPHSEKKLIQCIKGSIFDVVIDIRKNSKTYGKWLGNELSERNKKMLYIPEGVMHGFQALEAETVVQYPVSSFYAPDSVIGLRWDDPSFGITWPISKVVVSDIDKAWPNFPGNRSL